MSGECCFDFVFCIEATSNMASISKEVNCFIKSIALRNIDVAEELGLALLRTRVKIILFRDFSCCTQPIVETKFFVFPDEKDELNAYIDNIEYKGGYGYCNALEAIALALKSDWTTEGTRRRHCVGVFSNGKVRSLGGNQMLLSKYPPNMPTDITQLSAWWEGEGLPVDSSYKRNIGYLLAFVPCAEPWIRLQSWNRYWPIFSSNGAGVGVCDIDIQSAFDMLYGS